MRSLWWWRHRPTPPNQTPTAQVTEALTGRGRPPLRPEVAALMAELVTAQTGPPKHAKPPRDERGRFVRRAP